MEKSKSVIQVTYTVESNENPAALKCLFTLTTLAFKEELESHGYDAKFISGPTFDVYSPHDPLKDGPKTNKPGDPDAIDPVVVIGGAKVVETRVDPATGKPIENSFVASIDDPNYFDNRRLSDIAIDPRTGKPEAKGKATLHSLPDLDESPFESKVDAPDRKPEKE